MQETLAARGRSCLAVGVAVAAADVLTDSLWGDLSDSSVTTSLQSGGVVAVVFLVVTSVTDRAVGRGVLAWALAVATVAVPAWMLGVAAVVRGSMATKDVGLAAATTAGVWVAVALSWWWTRRRADRRPLAPGPTA